VRILLFVLAARSAPHRSSSVGEFRGARRNKERELLGTSAGRNWYLTREKRGQLAYGHGAEEIPMGDVQSREGEGVPLLLVPLLFFGGESRQQSSASDNRDSFPV